jgi:cytochrome c peroxidase
MNAISAQAQRGMQTAASVGCIICHSGATMNGGGAYEVFPTFTDNAFVAKYHFLDDKGRGAFTGNPNDDFHWKVPTWRNVALTAPYFHNGAVKTLSEAVQVMAQTQLNVVLSDQQVSDIVEFLNTLTGEFPEQILPRLPDTPGETVID